MVRVDFFKTSRLQEVGSRGENLEVLLRTGDWKRSRESVPVSRIRPSIRISTPASELLSKFVTLNPQTLK